MSLELAEWFEEKASNLGVTQSSMMVMALGDYKKQELAVSMMANFDYVAQQLEELKGQ